MGQGKRYFDGCEFCLSDHFGLVVHVDVDDAYASGAKQDCVRARARRGQLVAVREESEQREAVEVKAMQQAGRESAEIARRRAADRDKVDFQKGQRRAARQRQSRRAALHEKAFGAAGLFAPGSASEPALSAVVPCAPAEVVIPDLDDVSDASWATVRDVALRGLRNVGNTCYLNSVAQASVDADACHVGVGNASQCSGLFARGGGLPAMRALSDLLAGEGRVVPRPSLRACAGATAIGDFFSV